MSLTDGQLHVAYARWADRADHDMEPSKAFFAGAHFAIEAAVLAAEQPQSEQPQDHLAAPQTEPVRGDTRRVVCAAIRAADGSLLLGIRHYSRDMWAQIGARSDGEKFTHRHDPDQGFVDQHGVYLTREEAYPIAKAAGQIVRPDACRGETLYSEGLY